MKRILNILILFSLSSSLVAIDRQEIDNSSSAMSTVKNKVKLYLNCLKQDCSQEELEEAQQDLTTAVKIAIGAVVVVGVGYGLKYGLKWGYNRLNNNAANTKLRNRQPNAAANAPIFNKGDKVLYEGQEYIVDDPSHKDRTGKSYIVIVDQSNTVAHRIEPNDPNLKKAETTRANTNIPPRSSTDNPRTIKVGERVLFEGNEYTVEKVKYDKMGPVYTITSPTMGKREVLFIAVQRVAPASNPSANDNPARPQSYRPNLNPSFTIGDKVLYKGEECTVISNRYQDKYRDFLGRFLIDINSPSNGKIYVLVTDKYLQKIEANQ